MGCSGLALLLKILSSAALDGKGLLLERSWLRPPEAEQQPDDQPENEVRRGRLDGVIEADVGGHVRIVREKRGDAPDDSVDEGEHQRRASQSALQQRVGGGQED